MSPAAARASYRRQLTAHGHGLITIRRGSTSANALCKVTGYTPDELVGGVTQGDQKVILLAEDLEKAGFPIPPEAGDEVDYLGTTLFVMYPPTRRRIGMVDIAYGLLVRG